MREGIEMAKGASKWIEVTEGVLLNFDIIERIGKETKRIKFYIGDGFEPVYYDTEDSCNEAYEQYKEMLCIGESSPLKSKIMNGASRF